MQVVGQGGGKLTPLLTTQNQRLWAKYAGRCCCYDITEGVREQFMRADYGLLPVTIPHGCDKMASISVCVLGWSLEE